MRAPFLVLEGPDGSGTTLHTKLLTERLQSHGFAVFQTAEPTDGPIGIYLRTILREKQHISPDALQLLFCADRAAHVAHQIVPKLDAGNVVVSDRYIASTVAYGEALGLDGAWLRDVNKNFIQPEQMILLLPPLSVCLERLGSRAQKDLLEGNSLQAKVHTVYRRMADADPSITVIDSAGAIDETAEQIWETVASSVLAPVAH